MRDYLALAQTALANPFRFKADQKTVLDFLNRAYEKVAGSYRDELLKVPHDQRDDEWRSDIDALPFNLHQVRDKHLELVPANIAERITELRTLRDEAKARLIEPKTAARRTYTKADGAVVTYDPAHPVAVAIEPLKVEAQNDAEASALETIANVSTRLEEAGGDLDVVAPRANRKAPAWERDAADGWRSLIQQVASPEGCPARWRVSKDRCDEFVARSRRLAGEQFEAFAHKLVGKIGEATAASIKEQGVWEWSILTVIKADGSVQRWKTQRIVNRSYRGTMFYQWPTRLMK